MAGSRAVSCPACGRTYDKRSPHNCPAAPPEPPAERYPLVEIPHGGPGKCPYPRIADPPRSWCDRCNDAMKVNERRILIFDHTPGAGPWPGTCTVPKCPDMILTGDLCGEHYGERQHGQRRARR